jgi:hypothetical protein
VGLDAYFDNQQTSTQFQMARSHVDRFIDFFLQLEVTTRHYGLLGVMIESKWKS